jgi:hypothetical protein
MKSMISFFVLLLAATCVQKVHAREALADGANNPVHNGRQSPQ